MRTTLLAVGAGLLFVAAAQVARAEIGDLRVEIRTPSPEAVLTSTEPQLQVSGGASVFGGVDALDLFLVIDTSKSLKRTDPQDYRVAGAVALVEHLPAQSDIQVGVVDFDSKAKLASPLTADREAVVAALRELDRSGRTNLAAGIRAALQGFETVGRPGASRVMLVFTDGISNERKALTAMEESLSQGVAIHTLLLGSEKQGAAMLRELAEGTGGSFLQVTEPAKLPEAFVNLRTTGVESVVLRANGGDPIAAELAGGTFNASVPVVSGENHIVAVATSLDGRTQETELHVTVRAPGCGELELSAVSEGRPARSLSDRSVELVIDSSRSMWGRMEGRPKMVVAQEILLDALDWLPSDLQLSLRAYGHQNPPALHDCQDSQLLVPRDPSNRDDIRSAIAALRPRGQTPLAYALEQAAADFGDFRGERAVVLVTDGIESCDGDPVAAARGLQQGGSVPVHVIGFGLGNQEDEDLASLQAIAEASGGRFLTVGSAAELREALSVTVGTPFLVWRGAEPVADGILGSGQPIPLPAGDYVVRVESAPPREVPVRVSSEENLSVVLERSDELIASTESRSPISWSVCEVAELGQDESLADAVEPASVLPQADEAAEESLPAAPSPDEALPALQPLPSPPVPEAPSAGVPAPSTPESEAPTASTPTPNARKWSSVEVPNGRVEVWQNLRPDARETWGVVVRHPLYGDRPSLVWRGNDLTLAEQVANGLREKLLRSEAAAAPAP